MSTLYPVYLDLHEKKCLVVGGGKVAERKISSLLDCGGRVFVVSPQLTPELARMAESGEIVHIHRNYTTTDLENAFLVVSATDDEKINRRVADDCLERNVLVNVVDDPAKCNFFVPAVFRQGALSISVSTEGKSPMLARKIREGLPEMFGPEYSEFLDLMGILRERIITTVAVPEERRRLFYDLVNSDILDLLKTGQHEKVKERIDLVLGSGRTQP